MIIAARALARCYVFQLERKFWNFTSFDLKCSWKPRVKGWTSIESKRLNENRENDELKPLSLLTYSSVEIRFVSFKVFHQLQETPTHPMALFLHKTNVCHKQPNQKKRRLLDKLTKVSRKPVANPLLTICVL